MVQLETKWREAAARLVEAEAKCRELEGKLKASEVRSQGILQVFWGLLAQPTLYSKHSTHASDGGCSTQDVLHLTTEAAAEQMPSYWYRCRLLLGPGFV
jgi:hypothetical protein